MEGEAPVVDVVYQRLLQLVGRAFYVRDYRELSVESQPEAEAEATPSQRKNPGKKKEKVLLYKCRSSNLMDQKQSKML